MSAYNPTPHPTPNHHPSLIIIEKKKNVLHEHSGKFPHSVLFGTHGQTLRGPGSPHEKNMPLLYLQGFPTSAPPPNNLARSTNASEVRVHTIRARDPPPTPLAAKIGHYLESHLKSH